MPKPKLERNARIRANINAFKHGKTSREPCSSAIPTVPMKARSSVKRCVGICFVVAQLAYLSTYWYSTWLNARVPCSTASECPGDGGESPRLAKPPVFNSLRRSALVSENHPLQVTETIVVLV